MINSEDDVRAWVRAASGNKARWVEPALGSTPGLPDCWVPWEDEKQVHLELKVGVLRGKLGESELLYQVRPEQRREIRGLILDKVPVGLLIGIKGTHAVLFALAHDRVLAGRVGISSAIGRKNMWWCDTRTPGHFSAGVNFIFLNFRNPLCGRTIKNTKTVE